MGDKKQVGELILIDSNGEEHKVFNCEVKELKLEKSDDINISKHIILNKTYHFSQKLSLRKRRKMKIFCRKSLSQFRYINANICVN